MGICHCFNSRFIFRKFLLSILEIYNYKRFLCFGNNNTIWCERYGRWRFLQKNNSSNYWNTICCLLSHFYFTNTKYYFLAFSRSTRNGLVLHIFCNNSHIFLWNTSWLVLFFYIGWIIGVDASTFYFLNPWVNLKY